MRRIRPAETAILAALVVLSLPAWLPVGIGLGSALFDARARADMPAWTGRGTVLLQTTGLALLVASCATILAAPMAQVLRTSGLRTAALLMAPVWIPAWLMYAGLNLARAPDTLVGAAFMDWALDPEQAWWGESNRWAIVALGRTLAVGAMVLWSTPIAALVMAGVEDPDADAAAELARTDPLGRAARVRVALRLRAGAIALSVVVIALLTMGSAVPLHLAQVETDAIALWRALSERPVTRWGGVWLAAWPHVLIAGCGAWWIASRLGRRAPAGTAPAGPGATRAGPTTRTLAWLVWSLAGVLPLALMLWSLDDLASVGRWVRMDSAALFASAQVAGAGATLAALLGVAVAASCGSSSRVARAMGRSAAAAGLFGALVPGVLVGAAIAGMGLSGHAGGGLGSVLAAGARVACVGVIAGLVVARSEPADEHAARAIDGAGDAFGWLRANRWRAWRLGLGAWLGAFVLALHEIEASVMVRPPGRGNLPQQMLADLHYARLEQLSAGGVVLGLLGIGFGIAAGAALAAGARRRLGDRPNRPNNPGPRQP